MFEGLHRCGWFRSLRSGEEEVLLRHLLRLPPEDLRRRFLREMDERRLRQHVDQTMGQDAQVIGWFSGGEMRGAVEIFYGDTEAEAAFTVEPGWRGKGIGTALMRHAVRRVRNRGIGTLQILTTRGNTPMVQIARGQGADLTMEGGEVLGEMHPEPGTYLSLAIDIAEEEAGILAGWLSGIAAAAGRLFRRRRARGG